MPRTKDALEIIAKITGTDENLTELVARETVNLEVARMIHDARRKAGLTQAELGRRVGTTQSVIARLENADYEGHSLGMLSRIARALKKRIEIRFRPLSSTARR